MTSLFLNLPLAGVAFALRQSTFAGQAIVVVLFVGSMLAWSVMVTKFRQLAQARRASVRFLSDYRRRTPMESLLAKDAPYRGSPLFTILGRVCDMMGEISESKGGAAAAARRGGGAGVRLKRAEVERLRDVAERTMAEQALDMGHAMGTLATAANAAPFLGLLGTVWGVMEAFGGMALTGAPMLADVAPGISAALLTTVIGLLVALPSSIGYNVLSERLKRLLVEMENFCGELMSDIVARQPADQDES